MKTAALIATTAATVAMLVCIAVGIGALLLQARIRRLADQMQKTLESEVSTTLRAWRDAAQGLREAVAKLDSGLGSLANTLQRLDRLTEKLEPDALARTLLQPALAKLLAWLGGLRKGLASARQSAVDEERASDQERQ